MSESPEPHSPVTEKVIKLSSESPDPSLADEDLRWAQEVNVDALYRKYAHRCVAFLASLGLRGADAEDVLQRSWIKMLEQMRRKPFEGNFRAWMFQILRNASIDFRRRKRPESMDPEIAAQVAMDQRDPSDSMRRGEYRDAIQRCIEKLPDQMKTLVRCRMMGEAYPPICKVIGLTVPQGHRLFFTAKESLARCLSDWDLDENGLHAGENE